VTGKNSGGATTVPENQYGPELVGEDEVSSSPMNFKSWPFDDARADEQTGSFLFLNCVRLINPRDGIAAPTVYLFWLPHQIDRLVVFPVIVRLSILNRQICLNGEERSRALDLVYPRALDRLDHLVKRSNGSEPLACCFA
jgi:hypothetical protein